jgi:hypothetical protein
MLGNQEKDKNELIASKAKLKVKNKAKKTKGLFMYSFPVTSCRECTFIRRTYNPLIGGVHIVATCHIL